GVRRTMPTLETSSQRPGPTRRTRVDAAAFGLAGADHFACGDGTGLPTRAGFAAAFGLIGTTVADGAAGAAGFRAAAAPQALSRPRAGAGAPARSVRPT